MAESWVQIWLVESWSRIAILLAWKRASILMGRIPASTLRLARGVEFNAPSTARRGVASTLSMISSVAGRDTAC